MPGSIEEVARRAGVSVATVSRALRGLPNVAEATRQRVVAAAEELQYTPDPSASRLAERRTRTVGVLVPYVDTWFTSSVLAGVHARCVDAALDTLLFTAPTGERRARFFADLPFRKRVDALVIIDLPVANEELERALSVGLPLVTVGLDDGVSSGVILDEHAVAQVLTRHVIGLGRRRIAVLGPCEGDGPRATIGALRASRIASVAAANPDVAVVAHHTGPSPAEAAAAMWRLVALPEPPDAVVALTDEVALGALRAARDAALEVPEAVVLTGIDDHPFAEVHGLTTIRYSPRVMGERAADLARAHLMDAELARWVEVVDPHLVVRASTGGAA